MAGNPIKSLVVVSSAFLMLLLAAYTFLRIEKERAFGLHGHENRDRVEPCLVLQKDSRASVGPIRGTIQDCLLFGPEAQALEVLEVKLRNGLFVLASTDVFIPGQIPIALTRVYRPGDAASRAFGMSSDHNYNLLPVGDRWPYTFSDLCFEDGSRIHYDRVSKGLAYWDAVYEQDRGGPTQYSGSTVSWANKGWQLERKDGWHYFFPPGDKAVRPSQAALWSLKAPDGRFVRMTREASGDLRRIESPDGSWVELDYDDHKIVRATDSQGRSVSYEYDGHNRLTKVYSSDEIREYFYDGHHNLVAMSKNGGPASFRSEYDDEGRLVTLRLADGGLYRLEYHADGEGQVETTVIAPSGEVAAVSSSRTGYSVHGWRSQ